MSADNGIYILETGTMFDKITDHSYTRRDTRKSVFRVAHAQGIDNLDWYLKNERENVGAYLMSIFDKSLVYDNIEDARKRANELYDGVMKSSGIIEYGIAIISHPELTYFGD